MDPITFEYQSPYVCFDNNPIYYSDLLGAASGTTGPEGDPDFKKTVPLKQPNTTKPTEKPLYLDPIQINQIPIDNTSVREPNIQIQEVNPTNSTNNSSASSSNPNDFYSVLNQNINLFSNRVASFSDWVGSNISNEIRRLEYGITLYGTGTGGENPTIFKQWKGRGYAESFADLVKGVGKMKKDHTKQINGKTVESGKKDMREFGHKDGQKKLFGGTGKDGEIKSPKKPIINLTNDTVIRSVWRNSKTGRLDSVIETYNTKEYYEKGAKAHPTKSQFK